MPAEMKSTSSGYTRSTSEVVQKLQEAVIAGLVKVTKSRFSTIKELTEKYRTGKISPAEQKRLFNRIHVLWPANMRSSELAKAFKEGKTGLNPMIPAWVGAANLLRDQKELEKGKKTVVSSTPGTVTETVTTNTETFKPSDESVEAGTAQGDLPPLENPPVHVPATLPETTGPSRKVLLGGAVIGVVGVAALFYMMRSR